MILAALPATLGAWIVVANVLSKEASTMILPSQIQALIDLLRGFRSRQRHAQRRRLVGHLAPLTLEREWLFGVLPPAVTANVLGRLDPASRKALRAACRRTRLCVGGATTRLLLDGRGLRRFTTAPLHVLFPQLRELHLTPMAVSVAAEVVGSRMGPASSLAVPGGPGPGSAGGPSQLLGLLESGVLSSLPRLELLDLSRWSRPACAFTRRDWKAFVTALAARDSPAPCGPSPRNGQQQQQQRGSCGGASAGSVMIRAGGLRPLCLRVDWRVLPLASVWTPPSQLPSLAEVQWAVKWAARHAPMVRLELEGPPLRLPGPGHLSALRGITALRRLPPLTILATPPWSLGGFGMLSSLQELRQVTLKLPEDTPVGPVLAVLQNLRWLDALALPATTVKEQDMPAIAGLRALRTLMVGGLVISAAPGHPSSTTATQDPGRQGPPPAAGGASTSTSTSTSTSAGARTTNTASVAALTPGLERLVVSRHLDVDQHVGLLPWLPALSALGVTSAALVRPLWLLPQPRPLPLAQQQPQPLPPAPQPLAPQAQPQPLLQELLQHFWAANGVPGAPLAGNAPAPPPPPQDIWAAGPQHVNAVPGVPPAVADVPVGMPGGAAGQGGAAGAAQGGSASAAGVTAATASQPPLQPQSVCLRELCVMHERSRRQRRRHGSQAGDVPPGAATPESESGAVEGLLAQVAALPTLQRIRLWNCRSPEHALGLLRPVVERLQLPLVQLELHDTGPAETRGPSGLGGGGHRTAVGQVRPVGRRAAPLGMHPHRHPHPAHQAGGSDADSDADSDVEAASAASGADLGWEDEDVEDEGEGGATEDTDIVDSGAAGFAGHVGAGRGHRSSGPGTGNARALVCSGRAVDSDVLLGAAVPPSGQDVRASGEAAGPGSRLLEGSAGSAAASASTSSQGQHGCGGGRGRDDCVADEEDAGPVLLTSLLGWRPWRSASQQLAALLLGCCRTLVVSGGDQGLLDGIADVGAAAATAASARAAPVAAPGTGSSRSPSSEAAAGKGLPWDRAVRSATGAASTTARAGQRPPPPATARKLILQRHSDLDGQLLQRLVRDLPPLGLQTMGLVGCGRVAVRDIVSVRRDVGACGLSLAWAVEVPRPGLG